MPDAGSSVDDREQVKAVAPTTGPADASVNAELVAEPGPASRDTFSDLHSTEACQLHATTTLQHSSPDVSNSDSQLGEFRPHLEPGELAAIQRLLGDGPVGLPEAQLSCIVQGMRMLVTLLRDDHTWQPVSPCVALHGSQSMLVGQLHQHYLCVVFVNCVLQLCLVTFACQALFMIMPLLFTQPTVALWRLDPWSNLHDMSKVSHLRYHHSFVSWLADTWISAVSCDPPCAAPC